MPDTCLSTMWAVGRFARLVDFFPAARALGYRAFELNHQADTPMLAGLDPRHTPIASVHEPCPADISTVTLKARDWLISATDEEARRQGLWAVQRSIDLAQAVGARLVVVHAGRVDVDADLEAELWRLFEAEGTSPRYQELRARLVALRAGRAGANLEAAHRSLVELAEYAGRAGVRLGLENRYHFLDIPLCDEMGMLLERLDAERVGYWHDVGHASALERLGFGSHLAWLERYAGRMLGVHLHDIRGLRDHLAAGLGELDWAMVAAHLPGHALRTCEFQSSNTPREVAEGLRFLADHGCLQESAGPPRP